jgi:ParE toxin of type II toxin-antitoxin system, parDE
LFSRKQRGAISRKYGNSSRMTAKPRLIGSLTGWILCLRCYDNPRAGRARPELAAEIRSFPVGSYVLFYRPIATGVELVRVRNGYLDIQAEDMH